jgi:hypothetical protein
MCQVFTETGNFHACAQRFFVNENNKEEGVLQNNVFGIAKKAHRVTVTVRNSSFGKTLRCMSH